jgi:predicted RNA-binding protein with TRAM domain
MSNNGDIEVSGRLQYTWEGTDGLSPVIYLEKGESLTWEIELTTSLGAHEATFVAGWVPLAGSWDDNPLNNEASGTVSVEAELRLEWWLSSFSILDDEANPASSPLDAGETYTISIDLTSTETGSLTFDCIDGNNEMLGTMGAAVENRGDRVSLTCDFVAYAPLSTVRLVPSDSTVTNTFTRTFATVLTDDAIEDLESNAEMGTFTIIGLSALILIGVLVAAILMTRDREEEVERDIFDYCPACDGELEGGEDRCPHCAFNLKKARKQFHDCQECGESIPDLLDNCPYCGAEQDVSSYFERRERREPKVKETVSLPDEEVDEDEIVEGTENFAQAVKDFGYDEDNLEDEWDTNIVSAEAEIEAAYDRRNADEIERENMTEEELEAYDNTVTTTLKSMDELGNEGVDIDAILKEKGDVISLKDTGDDGSELSASDADIRGRLYEITGEDGIMPGDKVQVGMKLTDSSFAGNEVADTTADFSWNDEDKPEKPLTADNPESSKPKPARRRAPRRRTVEDAPAMSECGACGADIPMDAKECSTCGAKFE